MEAKQLIALNNRFRTEANKEVFDLLFEEFLAFNDPAEEELCIAEFDEKENEIYNQIVQDLKESITIKSPSVEKSYIRKLIAYTNYRNKYTHE